MRRIDHEKDLVQIAVVDKILCDMRSMAIEDKQLIAQASLSLCRVIEHLFEPGKAYIVVCPD
jgi:hypothetical protein